MRTMAGKRSSLLYFTEPPKGVLMLHMRGNDWMGRLGGDEFAVLLEQTGQEEAVRIGQRLRRALAASTFHWEGSRFNISCSIGIVCIDGAKLDVSHVLRAADRAFAFRATAGQNKGEVTLGEITPIEASHPVLPVR